ncbi:MAG: hemolysin family protein [Actinomycetota bacterium]
MIGWLLLATLLLLLTNAFFVGMEFALIAARRTKIEHLASEGNRRADFALRSIRELSFMLAAAQLGITMASLGLGAIGEPAVARIIENALNPIELSPAVLHSISFVVALTIIVFLHMVVGEMAPKNVAIAVPERSSLFMAIPARVYANLFRPFIHLLNALSNGVLRLVGVEPRDELLSVHSLGEIGVMVEESAKEGLIKEFEGRLLSGAVGLGELDAGAAMVPRTDVAAVPITNTPADIERVVLDTGHSRIPVFEKDLDHVLGFFHAKDLLRIDVDDRERPLSREYIRRMLVVPESRKLQPLLLDMRRHRSHVVLVLDEHGGTAGIVTIEDVIEELVGEIRDEYDVAELDIEQVGPDRYLVPGSLRIDEAEDLLGIELPEGEYETIAGFLMDRLGRIPKRLDSVTHDGWRVRVRTMHRRRVVQVMIERTAEPPRSVGRS